MEEPQTANFEALLRAAKSKPPARLKISDIKRLLNAAGKRPTALHATQVAELITTGPGNPALVYEIIGTLELAASPNRKLALLKPALSVAVNGWHLASPPGGQEVEPVLSWLEAELGPETPPIVNESKRARAVLLWLVAQYRNPDLFLKSLQRAGSLFGQRSARLARPAGPVREPNSGFIMDALAKKVFSLGRGTRPKFDRISEIARVVWVALAHVREQTMAAEATHNTMAEVQGRLAEQQRINAEQATGLAELERNTASLQNEVAALQAEVARWAGLHQQAVAHSESQVREAERTLLNALRTKIRPKLSDATLYANRPSPAVDQVLRLIGEVNQVLQEMGGHQ